MIMKGEGKGKGKGGKQSGVLIPVPRHIDVSGDSGGQRSQAFIIWWTEVTVLAGMIFHGDRSAETVERFQRLRSWR